ncbi:MAG: aquaporin [Ilumatobacteraceae bacterium]|nr:aquaporin [Ilumatobacteraceae bacterium]
MTETTTGRLVAAEFVGTTVVMLGGPGLMIVGGDDIGTLGVAVGFGVSIAIAIGVIGAVANPMFSLALWFSKGVTTRELLSDWVGQFAGAVFGAALLFGLNDTTRFVTGTNGWDPGRADTGVDLGISLSGFADLGVVLAAELALGTIVVVVLLSSISQQRSNSAMAAFTGAAYALGTLFLLGISGAGMNPARSLGTAIFADTDPNALGQLLPFVIIPLLASFAGTMIWLMIDDATIDDTLFDDSFLEDAADAVTGD